MEKDIVECGAVGVASLNGTVPVTVGEHWTSWPTTAVAVHPSDVMTGATGATVGAGVGVGEGVGANVAVADAETAIVPSVPAQALPLHTVRLTEKYPAVS